MKTLYIFQTSKFYKICLISMCFIITSFVINYNAHAKNVVVFGEYSYHYGDNESLAQAKEICKKAALKNALESAMVFIKSDIRINASGLENMDVHSLTIGCLEDIEVIEERIDDSSIFYRLRALADVSRLEEKLHDIGTNGTVEEGKKFIVAFYAAKIRERLPYCEDDTNGAPDSYVLVKDHNGNDVFRTGHYFLNNRNFKRLLKNRNNHSPNFEGAYFAYTFNGKSYLLVYIMDWDGIEGFLGRKRSQDDIIGESYRIADDHLLGKRWIGNGEWNLEMEIIKYD